MDPEDITLPDTEEVAEQRERRRHFDEEWNEISEFLATIPLEPMVINISTKPEEEPESGPSEPSEPQAPKPEEGPESGPSGPSVPRTTAEMSEEILEILNSNIVLGVTCNYLYRSFM